MEPRTKTRGPIPGGLILTHTHLKTKHRETLGSGVDKFQLGHIETKGIRFKGNQLGIS